MLTVKGVKSHGWRYRICYNTWQKEAVWAKRPLRAFDLLVITPTACWIDEHAVEAEISRVGYERAKENALRQKTMWISHLAYLAGQAIANRGFMRDEINRDMKRAVAYGKTLDHLFNAILPRN